MTKQEMLNQINDMFDKFVLKEPVTKNKFLSLIEETFENLLIDKNLEKVKKIED